MKITMKITKYIVYSLLAVFLFAGLTGIASATENRASNNSQAQEFAIRAQGKVKIVGGVVQDISTNKITVKVWDLSVSVNVNDTTILVRKFGGKSDISEFASGDTVNINGELVSGSPLVINGLDIRDKSTHKIRSEKKGTVQSVSSDGFVLKTEKGDELTIKVNGDTEITAGKETKSLSDIKVGDVIIVSGVVNTNAGTILAAKVKMKVITETIKNTKVNVEGTVQSLNADEKSFVLKPETGDNLTVKTDSDTMIKQARTKKAFSDLKVGDSVQVKGSRDAVNSSMVNATRVTIK